MKINYGKIITAAVASAYFFYYLFTYKEWHFIDSVNLLMHEAGHTLFFFGDLISAFGGTFWQIFVPLVFVLYFYFMHQQFSGALLLFWVGQNFINVSVYAGDAVAMQLPLLNDGLVHDWNHLLTDLGLLGYTNLIASALYFIGLSIIILAVILSFLFSLEKNKTN